MYGQRDRKPVKASDLETAFKQSSGHVARIVGSLLFAIVWNGIISVFVVDLVGQWCSGGKPTGETLFISIFVLIGICVVLAFIYNIMRAFNPAIQLQRQPCLFFPGAEERLEFSVSGNASRISALTITLIGTEQVHYRRGTDTATDHHEFFSSTLFTASSYNIPRSESFQLVIPRLAMPSFESANNMIIWKVVVHGDITRWPDVKEEYILKVNPEEACS